MSDYAKGPWEATWDGLFWQFINNHKDFFASNPRTSMLVHSYKRMSPEKRKEHMSHAEAFIQKMLSTK